MLVFIKSLINYINHKPVLIVFFKIVLILIIASLVHLILSKLIQYLPKFFIKYYKQLNQNLLNVFINSIKEPLIFLLWMLSLSYALENIIQQSLFAVKSLVVVLTATWLVLRILGETERYLINFVYVGDQKAYRRNKTSIIAINRILKVILVIIAILMTMQAFNINVTGIIALGGAGTIVIGLAAKELLANFFGGMMIFMDRQFMVGDSIRSISQNIEGKVEYIGWRLTRIRTLENSLLYVPNSAFLTMSVENSSKRYTRRIKEIIRFKYKDLSKIEIVLKDLQNMLKNHPDLDPNQMCFIGIHQFNYLAVDCLLNCFTKAIDLEAYLKVQHDILYKISSILLEHGIQIAFTSLADSYNHNAAGGGGTIDNKD